MAQDKNLDWSRPLHRATHQDASDREVKAVVWLIVLLLQRLLNGGKLKNEVFRSLAETFIVAANTEYKVQGDLSFRTIESEID